MRDVKSDLLHVREQIGVVVRRDEDGGCGQKEREKDDINDAEHEADLQEAVVNQTKAVRLVVDKWFVDRGFGFGKTTTGEIVFIHASVVQGAEVLMVGSGTSRQRPRSCRRGYRARRAWGTKCVETKKRTGKRRTEWPNKSGEQRL